MTPCHPKMHLHTKPDSMQFLETRSEVKLKVTVTQLWYATLCHPKMHPHTKFKIPTSNNMRYAPDTIILKTRSEVKVTVTRKWYATLRHPKMYPHTKFGIPNSMNIGDMDRTRKRDGRTDGQTERRTDSAITICLPKFLWGHKNKKMFIKFAQKRRDTCSMYEQMNNQYAKFEY